MKSPHLLSSECDLAICTRSAQASPKEFVATTQTVVSQCSFLTFQINTRQSFAASEGVFLSKARSFASNRPSLFTGRLRYALQAWISFPPRLLRTTVAPTTNTRPTPRLVAISRPADASDSHTTLSVSPYSIIAPRTSRAWAATLCTHSLQLTAPQSAVSTNTLPQNAYAELIPEEKTVAA